MSSEHPIDDLFRKELETREPEFREEYWKEAERMLDHHPQTSARNSLWKWFGSIIVIASVAGLAGYYFGSNHGTTKSAQQENYAGEKTETIDISNNSSKNNSHPFAMADSGAGMSDTLVAHSDNPFLSADTALSNQQVPSKENPHTASSDISPDQTSSEKNNSADKSGDQSNSSFKKPVITSSQRESEKHLKSAQNNSAGIRNEEPEKEEQNEKNISGNTVENSASATSQSTMFTNENTSQLNSGTNKIFMERLSFEQPHLTFDSPNASTISFTPSPSSALKKNHWSPLKALELSISGAPTLVTVPSANSSALGYEWNTSLQYRVNNFVASVGIGQFFVKDHISFSHDSITSNTTNTPFVTHDSLLIIDSVLVPDSNFVHWEYDTTLQITSDTTYIQVTTHDTLSLKKSYTSTGHYLELPVMFSYRFYGFGLRWQLSAGASYAWYSGGLRYGVNSEGQLISYKPPPVISILTRVHAQYPLTRKLYLQGYIGARYVMNLKSDVPSNNYLIYSLGAGMLYQF